MQDRHGYNGGHARMNIEKKALEITEEFHLFTEGVRVMMLINRGIGNSNKGSRRWINKLVSANKDEFTENLIKLLTQKESIGDDDNRIYLSVNPRKIIKAVKYFQHKQLDLNTEDEIVSFYKNINNNFCSALMQPENRGKSLFLIDYDNTDQVSLSNILNLLQKEGINVIKFYITPNGWHIICNPFNPFIIKDIDNCVIKKDALILLKA